MCQQKILEILETKKGKNINQLHKEIPNISKNSLQNNLRKLKKHNLVKTQKSRILTKRGAKIPITKYYKKTKG